MQMYITNNHTVPLSNFYEGYFSIRSYLIVSKYIYRVAGYTSFSKHEEF